MSTSSSSSSSSSNDNKDKTTTTTTTTTSTSTNNKPPPPQQKKQDTTSETNTHKYTNKLIYEKSPYLLQHAHNPVDWYPWEEEAFKRAKEEDKLIFLSIGYSTCHWCHVMERECFENPDIANVMNKLFINIKVDREERPDIDKIYMTYITEISGSGGWPLNVWLTPDLQPITGGTYFAPEPKYGRPGFPDLCEKLNSIWKNNRETALQRASTFVEYLKEDKPKGNNDIALSENSIKKCYDLIINQFDDEFGGFSNAPKFPRTSIFNFLHIIHKEFPDTIERLHFTLEKMAKGGMYDQLGGGFHRYSVTSDWKVPHFEKMLYDQGQLASVYLDAFQISKNPLFKEISIGILKYVQSQLTDKDGGFYSAEDADSLSLSSGEKSEGAFYIWKYSEIKQILESNQDSSGSILDPESFSIFKYMYGILDTGNVDPDDDPHGEFLSSNIIMKYHSSEECANYFKRPIHVIDSIIDQCKSKLFNHRSLRPRPHLDDKIITSWNGLMISAFCKAYQVLGDYSYLESAEKAIQFIKSNLYCQSEKTLIRNYCHGHPSKVSAFADDYSFLIQSLLDLYESNFKIEYLEWAVELQSKQDELFYDSINGGYFSTSGSDSTILARLKEDHDGAEPSCQSVSVINLIRLNSITYKSEYLEKAKKTMESNSLYLEKAPIMLPQMVYALHLYLNPIYNITIGTVSKDHQQQQQQQQDNNIGDGLKSITTGLIHKYYIPNKVILVNSKDSPNDIQFFDNHTKNETFKISTPLFDRNTFYICSQNGCYTPLDDIDKINNQLSLIENIKTTKTTKTTK
eukprot:gene9157-11223_t